MAGDLPQFHSEHSKKFLLIDASVYIHKSYHAYKSFVKSDNYYVGLLIFLKSIFKIIITYQPDYLQIVFDAGRSKFRNQIYPEYKANRKKQSPEIKELFSLARQAIKAMGFNYTELLDYEADDIIATYVDKNKTDAIQIMIISVDKDYCQLLTNNNICLVDTIRNKLTDNASVKERFGVNANQFTDMQSLIGDSVDNIPKIINPKTATQLIEQHGDLNSILDKAEQNCSTITDKVRDNILNNKNKALLYKQLVTLDTNVPIDYSIHNLLLPKLNKANLLQFLNNLNLSKQENYINNLPL